MTLYHGTGHWFQEGDTVRPTVHASNVGPATAWATPDRYTAAQYAGYKAYLNGALFGPIYEVEPEGGDLRTHPKVRSVGDTKGMRVRKLAGYGGFDGRPL